MKKKRRPSTTSPTAIDSKQLTNAPVINHNDANSRSGSMPIDEQLSTQDLLPLNQKKFLEEYGISRSKFKRADISWADVRLIYSSHSKNSPYLYAVGKFVEEHLRLLSSVHSTRMRVKEPEHLIEKIIRKRADEGRLDITADNYKNRITDLVGVRALHLLKSDWFSIHEYILQKWDLLEKPEAKVRQGDPETLLELFRTHQCDINTHPAGYRSVHYLLSLQPTKMNVAVEIQVRTLFEEGWSEIDHKVRYPYDLDNCYGAGLMASPA